MSRKLITGLRMDPRAPERASGLGVRIGYSLGRVSRHFGWPMLLILLVLPSSTRILLPKQQLLYSFFVLLLAGLAFATRIWSRGYSSGEQFVVEGPFRHVRNPVQVSYFLIYTSALLFFKVNFLVIFLVLIVAFVWMHLRSLCVERNFYLNLGPLFLKYKERVRIWLPSVIPEMNRSGGNFNPIRSISPSLYEALWLVGIALVYTIKKRLGVF
ncbi:hypothetical protein GW915_05405 [bacterium]|nr:hypothetical protein [bacterium]